MKNKISFHLKAAHSCLVKGNEAERRELNKRIQRDERECWMILLSPNYFLRVKADLFKAAREDFHQGFLLILPRARCDVVEANFILGNFTFIFERGLP